MTPYTLLHRSLGSLRAGQIRGENARKLRTKPVSDAEGDPENLGSPGPSHTHQRRLNPGYLKSGLKSSKWLCRLAAPLGWFLL